MLQRNRKITPTNQTNQTKCGDRQTKLLMNSRDILDSGKVSGCPKTTYINNCHRPILIEFVLDENNLLVPYCSFVFGDIGLSTPIIDRIFACIRKFDFSSSSISYVQSSKEISVTNS